MIDHLCRAHGGDENGSMYLQTFARHLREYFSLEPLSKIFLLVRQYMVLDTVSFIFNVYSGGSRIFLRGANSQNCYYYRPQRSWGKVMFLQASVILLTGGRGYLTPRTTYPPLTMPPRLRTPPQTTYPPVLCTPQDYIPPGTTYPPDYVPPDYVPPQTMYPPGLHTPPWTVYVQAVWILLECILVFQIFAENCMKMKEFGPPWIRQWFKYVYLPIKNYITLKTVWHYY